MKVNNIVQTIPPAKIETYMKSIGMQRDESGRIDIIGTIIGNNSTDLCTRFHGDFIREVIFYHKR